MSGTFRIASNAHLLPQLIRAIRTLPPYQNIAAIVGLGYVEELNHWGVLSEYIPAMDFDYFCWHYEHEVDKTANEKLKNAIQIAIQLAEGLDVLDKAGCTHTDLLNNNILICTNNFQPVLIDYYYSSYKKDHQGLS
jgi:serine/threonine protein kinase